MTTITGVTPFDNVQKLAPGSIVQPIAVMTNVAETSELAPVAISASAPASDVPGSEIIIDPAHEYQDWIGVGGAFTEATAYVLMTYMTAANRAAFLQKMFGTDGFQCLRICFGSSDYSFRTYYSYDDNGGVADPDLTNFSIQRDQDYIIPLLQEILLINPRIWIFASVWSPPAWLKTSASLCGGWFNATAANYTTYANYLVMAIQAYEACGIPIAAVTPQNEPQGNHTDYPSCEWTGAQLVTFIGSYLGPALAAANLNTEIIACDTSWGSAPSYGLAVLGDTTGKQFCQSVGYHGYNGYVSEVPGQLRPYPGTRVYFTEWISTLSGQGDSLLFGAEKWCADLLNNMVRYGARALMLWNIALDQTGAPYEQSPSTAHECRGMVTINNSTGAITYNSEYLAFAHISKYVQRGAKRIQSNVFTMVASNSYSSTVSSVTGTDVTNVAFKNPDGSIVVFLWNPLSAARTVVLTDSYLGQSMPVTIPAQSYQTVTWGADNVITTAATFTAPGAPTLGTPTTNSAGQVVVPITAPASVGSSDLGGYRVFAGSAAGAEATMPLFTIPGTSTSFTDTLLASGSTRFYKAEAFGLGGASAASNEVSGTPVAASATTYTLTGSAALNVGTASTFTVTPNAALYAAATITPACTVAGTFSPTSVTLAEGSSAAATFTFTPSATGTGTLSTTNSAGLTDPAGLAVTVAAATTPFTTYTSALSASSVVMGNPVTLTITPGTGAANTSAITVTPASTLAGVFSPATVSIPAGSTAAVTCTFTPSASGTATISTTNSGSLTDPASVTLTVSAEAVPSTAFTLTGAATGTVGIAQTLTLTPNNNGPTTATIVTLSDGGAGGTFSPATVTFAAGSATAETATYTPSGAATVSIGATNNGSLTNPAVLSVVVSAVATMHYLSNSSTSGHASTSTPITALDGYIFKAIARINIATAVASNALVVGNYPLSGSSASTCQFNVLLTELSGYAAGIGCQWYNTSKTYEAAWAAIGIPTSLIGEIIYIRAVNNTGTTSFTDTDGTVYAAGTVTVGYSTDGTAYTSLGTLTGQTTGINQQTNAATMYAGISPQSLSVYNVTVTDASGTVLWDPDFTTQSTGTTSFEDSADNTWTITSPATIV